MTHSLPHLDISLAPPDASLPTAGAAVGRPGVPNQAEHLSELDGWRGLSILAVLAAHLLPLNGPYWHLNVPIGDFGMTVFFCLSGFLITSFLLRRPAVYPFVVRRLCRILPLAYLYLLLVMPWYAQPIPSWVANFLFLENYQTEYLKNFNGHFWSLCVEVHFYAAIALAVVLFPRYWTRLLPVACLVITGLRVGMHTYVSIETHLRVDEILAGGCLALVYASARPNRWASAMARTPTWLAVLLLFAATLPFTGPLQYLRPYFGALAVGSTLFQTDGRVAALLRGRVLRYLATISYALYVIQPITVQGWLGGGPLWQKYLVKRPISLVLMFMLAHLSTYYWESRWIELGKRLTSKGHTSRAPK